VNGKNTQRLGVEEIRGPNSELLEVTNIARTLIDIAVRPAYAGGIFEVLKAYRAARKMVSPDQLLLILKKLDYLYPYHQAIGFLMETAGYPAVICAKCRALGLDFDFYLAHAMNDPEYTKSWRLYYPKELLAI
jgi:hypothetical protein